MTKTKSTKRALLMSALSLLMCVSMLIGSTFAWFTDSVTSSNNKIVAGNLDVELWMHNGTEYVNISDSEAPIFGTGSIAQNNNAETLWEPGKTQVAYLQIKNNGNLALKYTVGLDVQNVSKDLYKVMQYAITPDATAGSVTAWNAADGKNVVLGTQAVTAGDTVMNPGDVHSFALSIHMDEMAGNEYQNGEVDFDLTVMATQATVESDSFGNQYDANATNASIVRSIDDLKAAATKGGNIILGADLEKIGTITLKSGVVFDGNGHTISGDSALYSAGDLTVKNTTFKNIYNGNGKSAIYWNPNAEASIVVTGCTFDNVEYDGMQLAPQSNTTARSLNNPYHVNISITDNVFKGDSYRYIHIEGTREAVGQSILTADVTITGNKMYTTAGTAANLGLFDFAEEGSTFNISKNYVQDWGKFFMYVNGRTKLAHYLVSSFTDESMTATYVPKAAVVPNSVGADGYLNSSLGKFYPTVEAANAAVGANQKVIEINAGATGDAITFANSADSLKTALNNAKAGDTVMLDANIADAGSLTVKSGVTLDGYGKTISGNSQIYMAATGAVTVKNVVFESIANESYTVSAIYCHPADAEPKTITGCTFGDVAYDGIQIAPSDVERINVVITDNTFKGDCYRYIHVEDGIKDKVWYDTAIDLTITGNKMYTTDKTAANIGLFGFNSSNSNINISNNYAKDWTKFYMRLDGQTNYGHGVIANFAIDDTLTETVVPKYVVVSSNVANSSLGAYYLTEAEANAACPEGKIVMEINK